MGRNGLAVRAALLLLTVLAAPMAAAEGEQTAATAAAARERCASLRRQLPTLKHSVDLVRAAGQDISYPLVTYTVLANFVDYIDADLSHDHLWRALQQLDAMEPMAKRLDRQLQEAVLGRRRFPDVPRWVGTSRPRIQGPSFMGDVRLSPRARATSSRPVFFIGYGHFDQILVDIEKFPDYGVNVIQMLTAPDRVLMQDGTLSDKPAQDIRAVLDRAAQAGVAVDVLLSPHYMPEWFLNKYPHMRKKREGFIKYCLHAPEGQEALKQYVRALADRLKNSPALFGICLANEPWNVEEPCEYAARAWHDWLRKKHRTLEELNDRWRGSYSRFEDVPLANPFDYSTVKRPSPEWADFVRFNQEWFACWHKMLADTAREVVPGIHVHSKPHVWAFTDDEKFGTDAELFGAFSDINGCDSWNYYNFGQGDLAQNFDENLMGYDLLRSVHDAPVFNSENHPIEDGDTRVIPPQHVYTMLWQQSIYGQSATAIWVWERTFDPDYGWAGSIMHRPACAEAVGTICHDLNRVAPEISALQKLEPQIAILYSVSARSWDDGRWLDTVKPLHRALSFTGVKVGFFTERQLERGELPRTRVLLIPNILHLSDAAFKGLKRCRGRVVFIGNEDLLSRDEYDGGRAQRLKPEVIPFEVNKTPCSDLWRILTSMLEEWGIRPIVQVLGENGRPVWGVNWLAVMTRNDTVLNLCNYRNEPIRLRVYRGEEPATGRNVLTGEPVGEKITLEPLGIRLLRLGIPHLSSDR